MKRIFGFVLIAAVFAISAAPAFSQDDKKKKDAQAAAAEAAKMLNDTPEPVVTPPKPVYWTDNLTTSLNFDQTSFSSWAGGGVNNYKLNTVIRGSANWAKKKMYWNNGLELDYGFMYSEDKPIIQKYMDRMQVTSTWGYRAKDKLNYTATYLYRSQVANSWNYPTPPSTDEKGPSSKDWRDARVLRSGLLSPATMTLGLGIAWVPSKWLTVNIAPLTGSTTIVSNEKLRKNNGMARKKKYEDTALYPDQRDETGKYFETGNYYRPATFAFGAQVTSNMRFVINNRVNITSNLILFSNYLKNPLNMRVNWDNTAIWSMNKFFKITVVTNLVYDDNVRIVEPDFPNGHRAVQFKEYFLFGFSYTITNKK